MSHEARRAWRVWIAVWLAGAAGVATAIVACTGGSSASNGQDGSVGALGPPLVHLPSPPACRDVPDTKRGFSFCPPMDASPDADAAGCQDTQCGQWGHCYCGLGEAGPPNVWGCTRDECRSASDCATFCNCRGDGYHDDGINKCFRAGNCRQDSDCASGYCSPSYLIVTFPCDLPQGYFCHYSTDECNNDSDCPKVDGDGNPFPNPLCGYDPAVGHWTCVTERGLPRVGCADAG